MPRTSLPDACQRFTRTYGGTASSADRTRARGLQAVPQDRGRLFSRMSTCERRPAYGGIAPKPAGGLAKPWARVCLRVSPQNSLGSYPAFIRALPMVMAVAEGQPQNLRIHVRGSHWKFARAIPGA